MKDLATIYKNRLPKIMRGNPFWQDVIESLAEECKNIQESIAYKRRLLDLDADITETELLELAQFLGYQPDLSLIDDSQERITKLREEIQSVAFRIINKSTVAGYNFIFKNIGRTGVIYNMFADSADKYGLIRAGDTQETFTLMDSYPFDGSVIHYPAVANFAGTLFDSVFLDSGRIIDDANFMWYLDEADSISLTNHLAIEYAITGLSEIEEEGMFLMTPGLLRYLENAVHYNRKLTEIPHIGTQITIPLQVTNSLPLTSATDYVVPDLEIVGGLTTNYVPDLQPEPGEESIDYTSQFYRIEIGMGVQDVTQAVSQLAQPINSIDIVDSNIQATTEKVYVEKTIRTNTVLNEVIGTGEGSVQAFTGTTNLNPVLPKSVEVSFKEGTVVRTINDGVGRGELFQTVAGADTVPIGTIDYATGEYDFTTALYLPYSEILLSQDADFVEELTYTIANINTSPFNVRASHSTLSFFTSQGLQSIITEDQLTSTTGQFSGPGLDTSEVSFINYETGEVQLYFVNPSNTVTISYQLEATTIPNSGEDITINYEVAGDVDITEAGMFNADNEMIAYATFPPYRSPSSVFHFSLQFLIDNTTT